MEKDNKVKIYIGLIYILIISLFLWLLFNKFTISEITSYDFLRLQQNYLFSLKEKNLILISTIYVLATIFWTLMCGFGSIPILISGFIFGKWIATLLSLIGLVTGATLFYLLAKYFFKDLILEKFSKKFSWLFNKFKQNELIIFIIFRAASGIPFQIQNILPVLFDVKIKNFIMGSFLGMTPSIFIFCALGEGISKVINQNISTPSILQIVSTPDIYLSIIGFIIFLIFVILMKNKFLKN